MGGKQMGELGFNREEGVEGIMVDDEEEDEEELEEEKGNGDELEVVEWETLLPKMMLRVLLVEADDSTRQIISALLRKCNYKVSAISDGLKAWEILKNRHSNIDLILTELDLPSISGYALLALIMEHDGCKNIPVIIMSSQDSMSMVLKCMLKGAADFLIKPVRKNEVKNLWRHVWKRQAVNEHNVQNLATGHCKVEATFENQSATSHSSDNTSSTRKNSKFSEQAMEVQSSCTTPYLGAEDACMENMQDLSQIKHGEESGLIHLETKDHLKNTILKKEVPLEASDVGKTGTKLVSEGEQLHGEANVVAAARAVEDESFTDVASNRFVGPENNGHRSLCNIDVHELPERSDEAKQLIGGIHEQKCMTKSSANGELISIDSTPDLKLSSGGVHDSEIKEVDERRILKHSRASAFSWYSSNKKPYASASARKLVEAKATADTPAWSKPSKSNVQIKPNIFVTQTAHGEAISSASQTGLAHLPGLMFNGGFWTGYAPVLQPVFSPFTLPKVCPNSAIQREDLPLLSSPSLLSDAGAHSSSQRCSVLGDATNHVPGQPGNELKDGNLVEQCRHINPPDSDPDTSTPSNDLDTQHKSSAQGSVSDVTDTNATASDMMVTNLKDENLRDDGGNLSLDHDWSRPRMGVHSAEREAALAKFRLKRKGRCYEKKIRYQTRKKMAEQRPRVKGQFVQQTSNDQVCSNVDKP